jgi:hypothetical protein
MYGNGQKHMVHHIAGFERYKCGTRVDQSMTAVLYIRVTQEVLDTNKTKV